MTTRILFDSESMLSDVPDMYEAALEGNIGTEVWPCDVTIVEIGDRVYLCDPEEGIFASGVVIPVDVDDYDLLKEADGTAVSDAYLVNPYDMDEPYFVQIEIDAMVPYDEPLSWEMLQESDELLEVDWAFELSGEELDEEIAEVVLKRWEDYVERVGMLL